jgi:acyl carrier protein
MDDVRTRVTRVVSAVLGIAPETISDETSPDTVPTWDSMQHLQVVLALEDEFAVHFEVEEIEAMQRVGVMVAILAERATTR